MHRLRRIIATAAALCVVALAPAHAAWAWGDAARTGPPADFHAQSLSWASPDHGWMLGTAPCGQDTCTTVLTTTDGGGTWGPVGTIGAPLTIEQPTGVSEIRFADDLHGWAFDPALWTTTDGGATWTKGRPPGNRPVIALAGDAQGVYTVISACRFGIPISNCTHQETLWRTTPSQGTWSLVDLALPVSNQAILAVFGPVAYVVVPASLLDAPDVLEVTTDGQQWSTRPDPCRPSAGETLTSITAISDTQVALLCQGNIGFGKAAKLVYRSNDTAKSTFSAGTMNLYGIETQLASTPNGVLVAASYSIGSWIYRNAGGRTWTTQEDLGDGGQGWNDVVFTTNEIGFVIHGPATCCGGQAGELWETQDAGLTWGPVSA